MADPRIVQRGVARVETTAGSLDALVGITINSLKGKYNWDAQEIKDFGGFAYGWDARNQSMILTVQFELTAASQALAIANGAVLLEFAQINTTGFDLPWMNDTGQNGFFVGGWCLHEGGDIDLSNTKAGAGSISLRKYKDPTQNAAQFIIPA
jgi:hypothetical protein